MKFPNLSKILMFLTLFILVGLGWVALQKWRTPNLQAQVEDDFFNRREGARRGDDPTYAEEIRQNAAITQQTQRKQAELERSIAGIQDQLQRQSEQYNRQLETQVKALGDQLSRMQADFAASGKSDADNEVWTKQLAEVSKALSTLKDEQQKIIKDNEKRLTELTQSLTPQPAEDPLYGGPNENALREAIREVTGQNPVLGNQAPNATAATSGSIGSMENLTGMIGQELGITKPFGSGARNAQQQSSGIGGMIDQASSALGISGKVEADIQQGYLPGANATKGQAADGSWETVFPVYTLPPSTMLTDALLVTPAIGRVPIGREGNISDPFFFKVEIGSQNLAANGHEIRGVAKMIASGYATGIREQQCVRGYIDSITFIFIDGRIVSKGRVSGAGTSNNQALGYISDPWGKPCIRGRYINNASDYLKSRGLAAFVEAAAEGLSQGQVSYRQNSDGNYSAVLDGNVWQFVFGRGVSGTAAEFAQYVRERTADAFDVVYVEQGRPVQIMINQQIEINYDAKARKVNYYSEPARRSSYD